MSIRRMAVITADAVLVGSVLQVASITRSSAQVTMVPPSTTSSAPVM